MPSYLFEHPDTKQILEVVQKMDDDHIFIDKDGVKWNRIFTIPQSSIDSEIDPFNEKSFKDKTANKKETFGSLSDRSKELSEKRAQKEGVDPVRRKFFEDYSAKRKGLKHPEDPSKKIKNSLFDIA